MSAEKPRIEIHGAGILGLWQALEFGRAGYRVDVFDRSPKPNALNASGLAGAMLAPDCESDTAPDVVRDLGHLGVRRWSEIYPKTQAAGSLVVAAPRDISELKRFHDSTRGGARVAETELSSLEPDLASRFSTGLYYADEAHVVTLEALDFLRHAGEDCGVVFHFNTARDLAEAGHVPGHQVIDCRGMAAADDLPDLRGVRGERVLLRSRDVHLTRPVRLLHPRHPIYIVPWGDGVYMVGATVIESDDHSPPTVRSALELLGMAYSLHPAFGEAEILDVNAGVRPAFSDNVPGIIPTQDRIYVNGAYRHGFLLAPILAVATRFFVETGQTDHPQFGPLFRKVAKAGQPGKQRRGAKSSVDCG